MWPDSSFAKPVSSFERPVPLILIPPDSEPYMYVRFNRAWLPYILGSLKQLMLQTTWNTDDPNVLNQQQEYAGQILYEFMIGKDTAPVLGSAGADEGCNLIRQNPTNPCLLETSIDGINWCAFADLGKCFDQALSQPGSGSAQPAAGGGCQSYDGKLSASEQWLVPTIINTGDSLSFASIAGAGTDGSLHWYCHDGEVFFAGVCAGQKSTNGGDPAPTLPHMTLLAVIGSNYYDITAGPITVPGGVVNGQCYIQVNDSTLSNNSGDYKFTVTVCNNQSATFTHTFDFALNNGGFVIEANSGDPGGVYTLGSGWQPTIETGASHWYELFISRTFPSRTITGITAYYQSAWTTNTEPGGFSMYGMPDSGGLYGAKSPDQSTLPWPVVGSVATTQIKVDFNVGKTVSGHLSGQSFTLKKLVVTGIGTDPF